MEPIIPKVVIEGAEREVVVRTGEAEKIVYPTPLSFAGTINAPADYAEHMKKHGLLNVVETRVEVDEKAGQIQLIHNHDSDQYTLEKVVGKLVANPDLQELKIHTGTGDIAGVNPTTLTARLRPRRVFFKDREQWETTIAKLKTYDAVRNQTISTDTSTKDRDGSYKLTAAQKNELPEISFVLEMPLVRGGQKKSFRVDVCGDVTDGGVEVWLESLELRDLIEEGRQVALEDELQRFRKLELLIVTL
jgi:hypothetical protein